MIRPEMLCPSWSQKPLGEVVEFLDHLRRPITARDRVSGPYPYYGANGQQDSVADYIFDEPLILMAEDGGYFGDPDRAIAYRVDGKCWVNNHAHVLRPKDGVDIGFLCRQLEKYDVTRFINGATRQKLNKSSASEIPITLPPLTEQKRIAAILDKADAIRRKRQQAIQLADEFLRSVFLDMFGDPVSNSKNWDRKPIENTIEDIKPGWSIKGNNRDRKPGEWGVLKVSAVTSGRFLPEKCKVVAINSINREMVKPQKGDLLFTRANTRELVAATCIVERDYDQLFLPDKIWKIIPKQNILRHEFLRFVLSHPRYRDTIRKQATGTSGSMLNVSQTKIKHMIIPVPPLAFQEKFSKIFWKFYHIRNQVDESIQNTTVLFNSISQRAFRGEL